MAGLLPTIHDFVSSYQNVDARYKTGHDGPESIWRLAGPRASGAVVRGGLEV